MHPAVWPSSWGDWIRVLFHFLIRSKVAWAVVILGAAIVAIFMMRDGKNSGDDAELEGGSPGFQGNP